MDEPVEVMRAGSSDNHRADAVVEQAVPSSFGDLSAHTLLEFFAAIRAAARDEVDLGVRGHTVEDCAPHAFSVVVELYATTRDRQTGTTQRREVRTLVIEPVYTLTNYGEPDTFLGFDVRDTAIDDTDLSRGYVAPLAKGVDAETALRTVRRRVAGQELPRAVERDNIQRRWARQGNEQFADVLEEPEPNTRRERDRRQQ